MQPGLRCHLITLRYPVIPISHSLWGIREAPSKCQDSDHRDTHCSQSSWQALWKPFLDSLAASSLSKIAEMRRTLECVPHFWAWEVTPFRRKSQQNFLFDLISSADFMAFGMPKMWTLCPTMKTPTATEQTTSKLSGLRQPPCYLSHVCGLIRLSWTIVLVVSLGYLM